jgi:tetratricopeptide (TPR) repeat protein
MSLLLDALKKAAQERLDKEKKDREADAALNSENFNQAISDHTQIDASVLSESDRTMIDSTPLASYATEIDTHALSMQESDRTEMDTTTLAAIGTVKKDQSFIDAFDETGIDASSTSESQPDLTEYDAHYGHDKGSIVIEYATQFDKRDQDDNVLQESELELEPEFSKPGTDADSFDKPATTVHSQFSDAGEKEPYTFDRDDTTGIQARGERTTDFNFDPTRQDQTDRERTYSSSLTENLRAEHQQYYAGSPAQAAQVFAGKSPDSGNRSRLYFLSGLVVIALLLLGVLYGIDYVAELKQNQLVTPISRSRLEEPLSAALNRVQPKAESESEVDPELLIEQEDYTELLQDTLTAYEEKPVVKDKPVQSARSTTSAARQTVAGRSGEYTISRSKPRSETLRTVLLRGYSAYQAGNLDDAQIAYRRALTRAPRNRDALLGIAAIHVARGETDLAQISYNQLLQLDPHDDLALAGITSLGQQPGKAEVEISRIKLMLADKPDSAHLNFTLGNLYASQSRWAEAQQAYFDSARLDEKNPDYIFNLAVSLEHLGQKQAAVRFYRQALAFSQNKRSHFDQALAFSRIQALSAR